MYQYHCLQDQSFDASYCIVQKFDEQNFDELIVGLEKQRLVGKL